jgi:hypothetical protein
VADETVEIKGDDLVSERFRWSCSCGERGTLASAAQAKIRGDAHLAGHRARDCRSQTTDDMPYVLTDDFFPLRGEHTHSNCNCRPTEVTDGYWLVASGPRPDGCHGTSGKWLVFAYKKDHDELWARIRDATVAGRLGAQSKAATALWRRTAASTDTLVTCVYVTDSQNKAELRRVLVELRRLGVSGRLSYKTDHDTTAGRYGAGAALYTSAAGSDDFDTPRRRQVARRR